MHPSPISLAGPLVCPTVGLSIVLHWPVQVSITYSPCAEGSYVSLITSLLPHNASATQPREWISKEQGNQKADRWPKWPQGQKKSSTSAIKTTQWLKQAILHWTLLGSTVPLSLGKRASEFFREWSGKSKQAFPRRDRREWSVLLFPQT